MTNMTPRILHLARTAYKGFFRHPSWNLGVVYTPIARFLSDPKPEVHWFPTPPRNRFLADPFGLVRNGILYVFCEEFDYDKYKGRIVCIKIQNEHISAPRVAIELSSHMSYPYLIQHENDVYCVPETSSLSEIWLYKAHKFPLGWKKKVMLVDMFAGVDPTIFQYNGHWWLTIGTEDCKTLYIWYARELLGPWTPHPANPVKCTITSSRPAGTPFCHEGVLYRPAQDCSTTPGRQLVLNRVLKLTTSEFEEQEIKFIEPYSIGTYTKGIHTLSAVTSNMTLLDGNAFRFSAGGFRRYLKVLQHRSTEEREERLDYATTLKYHQKLCHFAGQFKCR